MVNFDRNFLRSEINSGKTKITREILRDLDFDEVLENNWLWLANPEARTDGEIYVRFTPDGDCYIEGNSMNGSVRYGNHFVGIDGDLEKLIMIVELLNV